MTVWLIWMNLLISFLFSMKKLMRSCTLPYSYFAEIFVNVSEFLLEFLRDDFESITLAALVDCLLLESLSSFASFGSNYFLRSWIDWIKTSSCDWCDCWLSLLLSLRPLDLFALALPSAGDWLWFWTALKSKGTIAWPTCCAASLSSLDSSWPFSSLIEYLRSYSESVNINCIMSLNSSLNRYAYWSPGDWVFDYYLIDFI